MSKDDTRFVAIVGGFYDLPADEAAQAKLLAEEFGAALANQGMGLVVYFSDENSLEPHVVSGYVRSTSGDARDGVIRVRYAASQRGQVEFAEQASHARLFEPRLFASDHWEAPFYRSLVEAEGVDAVLLMAGNHSTRIAGQIALARPLPILAIDQFGGAAREVWREVANGSDRHPSSSTTSPSALVALLSSETDARARHRQVERDERKNYLKVTSQARQTIWAALAFITLVGVALVAMARTPAATTFTALTFAGLIAAGATGATARSVIWRDDATAPLSSLLLGGIAGFVVGIAYLIPQWVGAPGVLAPTATSVSATDKIQFVSAVLVAVSAGVGFDTVFTRLKQQAAEQSVTPQA